MSDTVVRLGTPGEIAGSVPALLGFRPAVGDLVVIALAGRRVALTMRVDMPAPDEREQAADQLADTVRRAGGDAVLVLAYGARHSEPRVWAQLFEARGLAVRDAFRVYAGTVTCLVGCEHPLPDTTAVTVAATVAGQVQAAARAVLVERIAWSGTTDPASYADVRRINDWRVALATVPRRDAALAGLARKPVEDVRAALEDLYLTARHTPPYGPLRDTVLTVVAAAAYLAGDGGMANVALDAMREPTALARLLGTALRAALPPEMLREALLAAV